MALLDLMMKTGQAIAKGLKAAGTSGASSGTPSGATSTSTTGASGATLESLQAQKDANSAAWHATTDQAERDLLHQKNVALSKQMDAMSGGTSTFDSVTGKWSTTPAPAAAPTAPAAKNYDLSGYRRQQSTAEIEAALADLKGAYTKGMAAYDAQQDKLPERYRAAMNSAAAQSAMAKKNFDEQAAASGLNSGASGQAALDASAVYQGNISNLQQAKAQDMAEIDRAKADLTAQYETAVAKAKAEGNAELAKALYQEMIRVQGLEREDEQTAYDRGRDALADQRYDQQYADSRADTDYQRRADAAALMAQFGNFSGYADLWGLDQNTVNAMVAEYARQKQISEQQAALELDAQGLNNELLKKQIANYGKSTGNGGNINGGKPGKTLTYQDIYDSGARSEGDAYNLLVNAGYSSTEAKATAEYFMDYLDDHNRGGSPGTLAVVDDSGGISAQNFSALRQAVARYLSEGNEEAAKRLVDQNRPNMNANQKERMAEMLGL